MAPQQNSFILLASSDVSKLNMMTAQQLTDKFPGLTNYYWAQESHKQFIEW